MKLRCPCGRTKGLSNQLATVTGVVTLDKPMCYECRERVKEQMERGEGA